MLKFPLLENGGLSAEMYSYISDEKKFLTEQKSTYKKEIIP